ncbi:MAG: cation:proton antiporter [Leptospiraceae bacterium]|nr:cation:proton antiporter [Leptospiraceae bacterium]
MEHHSISLLKDIALGIIFATILSHIARILKQPLILGYILGGVILGKEMGFGLVTSEESIELISEIGLILLLFIIGLEINLTELAKMGKSMFTLGVMQFILCVSFSMGFFALLGYSMGGNNFDLLYIGVALSLSSTLIVVKLLQDKIEISTVAGKLTIGVLVLQDIWAILFMGLQPNLLDPNIFKIAQSIGIIFIILVCAFVISRYVLKYIYEACANRPELVVLTSISWCFIICGVADKVGLSKEMGALIAGMSIAAYPYGTDVISKLIGIRDFFVTLFFVSLGLKVQMPTLSMLGLACVVALFVVFIRLLSIAPVVFLAKRGLKNGLVTSLNLSQISEFSLVIIALGQGYGHVTGEVRSLILNSMILSSVLSTYLIIFNHETAGFFTKILNKIGISDRKKEEQIKVESTDEEGKRDIVLLGYFRIGQSLVNYVSDISPTLADRILVVDYNPANKNILLEKGFRWEYADLAHPDTLHHIGIHDAAIVICSISDVFLKGITSQRLLEHLKKISPEAKFIMIADELEQKKNLINNGAYKVIVPGEITGEFLFDLLVTTMRHV